MDIQILGLDISPTACTLASARCGAAGEAIKFECRDVIRTSLPDSFDVVTSSLFFHHLARGDVVNLLSKMKAAGRAIVVSDLRRSVMGYAVACAACRLLTRSRIVHHDGPQSVANAFTLREMREICIAAGLEDAIVRPTWPWRMTVVYEGNGEDALE